MSYAGLGHAAADLAGDPAVSTCGANKCFDPGTGAEQLVVLPTGGFAPHITTKSGTQTNNTVFTLKSYVTHPTNTDGADYRRVTVVVSWSTAGVTTTKQISTLVTYTQRGLPLPVFKLTSFTASPYAVNPSATAPFLLRLTNQGAPDRWDITRSGTAGWLFFLDDGDGVWSSTLDTTALADTDGNGKVDTGLVAPAGELTFWAVLPTTAATPVGTYPTTITATSAAQPLAAGGTATVGLSVSVQTGPVSNPTPTPSVTPTPTGTPTPSPTPSATPTAATTCPAAVAAPSGTAASGYTLKRYVLHNRSGNNTAWPPNTGTVPATTTTGQGIPLTAAVDGVEFPTATDPLVYSDNISPAGTPGRILGNSVGSQVSGTNPATMVDWRGSTTNKKDYSGTAVLQYWVAAVPGSPLTAVNLQAQLYVFKNGAITAIGSVATISGRIQLRGLAGGLGDDPGLGERERQPAARRAALEQRPGTGPARVRHRHVPLLARAAGEVT